MQASSKAATQAQSSIDENELTELGAENDKVGLAHDPAEPDEYRPGITHIPERCIPKLEFIEILNQGDTTASEGFALAAVINYMLHARGEHVNVSPWMLEHLARGFDKGDAVVAGGTVQSAIMAWSLTGVCPDELWPYGSSPSVPDTLPPEIEKAALPYKPETYERVPINIDVVQAAVNELGAVYVGADIHEGWNSAHEGIIDYGPHNSPLGVHAFAVLGYTTPGFIVQNSWGQSWGGLVIDGVTYPGLAIWPYRDFTENARSAWVGRLRSLALSTLQRAGYLSDTVSGEDRLDIMPDVRAICSMLAARDVKPPLALGLFGDWGTGKSFFMEKMKATIDDLEDRSAKHWRDHKGISAFCDNIVQISFNAWHYLDANLWASLVAEIFSRLFERISSPDASDEVTRKGILDELDTARGLYQQSLARVEVAKKERVVAQDDLKQRVQDVQDKQDSLDNIRQELGEQLVTLLEGDKNLKRKLDKVTNDLGIPQAAESYSELQKQAGELTSFAGRIRKLWQVLTDSRGRRLRLVLLVVSVVAPTLLGAALAYLAQDATGFIHDLGLIVNQYSGFALGLVAWLATQLGRGAKLLSQFEDVSAQVDQAQQVRVAQLTLPQQEALEESKQAEIQARQNLEAATNDVNRLERQLRDLDPGRQLDRFIEERNSAQDYRGQLGLVTLVRRDFEKLTLLMRRSDEARDKQRAALASGAIVPGPEADPAQADGTTAKKEALLPIQRIILYIDDLDRCRPERVIEVLEAVHLLLAFPLFVVVVAVDPRWLRQCLEMHYPNLLSMDQLEDEAQRDRDYEEGLMQPATPQDYLEKIFQIPFYLRPLDDTGYTNLIDGLIGQDLTVRQKAGPTNNGAHSNAVVAPGSLPTEVASNGRNRGPDKAEAHDQADSQGVDKDAALKAERTFLNPDQLNLKPWEIKDMKAFSALFHTPRAVKRFINSYRLLRVTISDKELPEFEGSEDAPGSYQVAELLLAVIAGYPNLAPSFLRRLINQAERQTPGLTWHTFLERIRAEQGPPSGPQEKTAQRDSRRNASPEPQQPTDPNRNAVPFPDAPPGEDWDDLCKALERVSKQLLLPSKIDVYARMAAKVARFSFTANTLPVHTPAAGQESRAKAFKT